MMRIDVDASEVMRDLVSLENRLQDMTDVMTSIGNVLVDSVHQNFDEEGRPRWPDRKDDNPWPILYKTGDLYNSIRADVDNNSVSVGSDLPYANVHDQGYGTIPQRQFLMVQPEDQVVIDELLFQFFS